MKKKAIILLSGGLDSSTVLALMSSQNYEIYALTFDYGQKSVDKEINCTKKLCNQYKVKDHKIIKIDLKTFGNSALTDKNIEVPKDHLSNDVPITYVPARNTILLSYALAYSEVIKAYEIFIAANQLDYSGYPDCREEYLKSYEEMANNAIVSEQRLYIRAPILNMNKSQIIKLGLDLGVNYENTISCYEPNKNGESCGLCESCILRIQGFNDNNATDPVKYINNKYFKRNDNNN